MDVNEIIQTLAGIDKDSFAGDDDARVKVRNAARALIPRLESTREMYCRILWHGTMLLNALGIAEELKFFKILTSAGEDTPKTSSYVADKASVSTELVQRVFRHLAAEHVVEECDTDLWKANAVSKVFATSGGAATIRLIDQLVPPSLALPRYLRLNSFKIPTDPAHTVWQLGTGDPATVFNWFAKHPRAYDDFNTSLKQVASDTPRTWKLLEDQSQRIKNWLDTEKGPLLVDIGGGQGQDVARFLTGYPKFTESNESRIVLMDRAEVIYSLPSTLPSTMRKESIDFLVQHPPAGALFYHYSLIMHDWPNDVCTKLLTYAASEMIIEKSRILLHELVIPKQGADPFVTAIDLLMMVEFGAKERTIDEWYELIESIPGLKIAKIHSKAGVAESVIEVKRVA